MGRLSKPRSWSFVLNARNASARPKDHLRDARLLKLVKRRTRVINSIKQFTSFVKWNSMKSMKDLLFFLKNKFKILLLTR